MSRVRLLLVVLALLGGGATWWGCAASVPAGGVGGQSPNVLILLVDCLRWDRLSSHGYERPTTPSLDLLAAEGASFDQAWAQASWTRPSVPTLLTGLYPSEHGLGDYDESAGEVRSPHLSPAVTTLAEAMRARGYATGLFGDQFQLSPRFGLDQGFDEYHYKVGSAASIDLLFLDWLRRLEAPRFFAYLHYLEIHWPYCPPEETRGVFDTGASQIGFCRQWRQLRDDIHSGAVVLDEVDRQAMAARHDEELLGLDNRLGELFEELRHRGVWDDTLIVVTADHGEEFFERGGIGHGQSLHEELLHVPLLVKPPASWQVPRGVKIGRPVELRSVAPTLLEAIAAPPVPAMRGESLLAALFGRQTTELEPVRVAESLNVVALARGRWKLIAARDGSHFELYDLAADPGERHDLSSERRGELRDLRAALVQWQERLLPLVSTETEALDNETLEGLKALGYLE